MQSAASALVRDIRARFGGGVVVGDDPDYDAARAVFYGGNDRQPLAIIRPDRIMSRETLVPIIEARS